MELRVKPRCTGGAAESGNLTVKSAKRRTEARGFGHGESRVGSRESGDG